MWPGLRPGAQRRVASFAYDAWIEIPMMYKVTTNLYVASFAYDAWIEILILAIFWCQFLVASFAYDAWIEIYLPFSLIAGSTSSHHLRTMRGLK